MRYRIATRALVLVTALCVPLPSAAEQSSLPVIVANDNRTPAGNLKDGILILRPFAEQGEPPHSPGPLLRVPQGTRVHASIRNLLPLAAKIHGLHAHPAHGDEVVQVNVGETREVQFDAGEPGTYM